MDAFSARAGADPAARRRRRLRRRRTDGRPADRDQQAGEVRRRLHAARVRRRRRRAPSSKTCDVVLEQNGKQFPLFTLADQKGAQVKQDGADRLRDQPRDRQAVGAGAAVAATPPILVTAAAQGALRHPHGRVDTRAATSRSGSSGRASRSSRRITTSITAAPRWSSTARRRKTSRRACWSATSSIRDIRRPGAALEGVKIADPALRVAFFALLHDQDLNTPIRLFARDEAGNTARADFDYRVFPKPFKNSRIDARRQAPRPRRAGDPRRHDRSQAGRRQPREVPGDQRRAAAEERREDRLVRRADQARAALARRRCSTRSRNTAVESAFADHRTYIYKGKEVDQQMHLGFDLASFAGTPIVAANRGKVALRRRARHLRQLRDHRPRHGRAVALRAPLVDRRQGRRRSRRNSSSAAAA